MLLVAACVVREFARVAIVMPMNPAEAENTAPTRYASAMTMPPLARRNTVIAIATATRTNATVRYSRVRKASAPSWMCFEIFCISAEPASCLSTQLA